MHMLKLLTQVVQKVAAGMRPAHLYAVPELEELWTHPDGLGTFEVLSMSDPSRMAFTGIKARA
jgi:hypothetical protein